MSLQMYGLIYTVAYVDYNMQVAFFWSFLLLLKQKNLQK